MTELRISRRKLLAGAAVGTVTSLSEAQGATADYPAGFPASITEIPFGSVSHWLQPWRELCQTRSLDQIEAGIGIVIGGYSANQKALDMLRQQGFRLVRVEIPWGSIDPQTETHFINQAEIISYLARLRKAGLRPLVLLNANHHGPCPTVFHNVQLAADAPAGTRSITLVSTAKLVPGRSGFKHLDAPGVYLGSILVSGIDGQQVSLSKPLPLDIPAGTSLSFVTLSYEPFSQPGTPRNERTMQGWLRYVDLTCSVATAALGTGDAADRGFDLEVWNELSFGSNFLSINNYYQPKLIQYQVSTIYAEIVARTAAQVKAGSNNPGVQITDGFANTIPWDAASMEPAGVSAISKHPYPPTCDFPKDGRPDAVALDAFGKKTVFTPSYKCVFPEYYGHAIQTESICRDLSDKTNHIYKAAHGRLSRIVNGQVSPVDVWITEMGCEPPQWHIDDPAQSERLLTAFTLRSLFFYLGIGAARVYMYQAFGPPISLGLDDAPEQGPSQALLAVGRMLAAMRNGAVGAASTAVMPISVTALRGDSGPNLFAGDGTPNLPPLTMSDSLMLLPVQISGTRVAVIYYVMTRDIRIPIDQQGFKIIVEAANFQNFTVSAYDPVADQALGKIDPITTKNGVTLQVFATDMPRLLLLDQAS